MFKHFFNKRRIRRLIITNIILALSVLGFALVAYCNVSTLSGCFSAKYNNEAVLGKIHIGKFTYIEQDDTYHETWRIKGTPFYLNKTLVVWISQIDLLTSDTGNASRKDYLIYDDSLLVLEVRKGLDGSLNVTDEKGKTYLVHTGSCDAEILDKSPIPSFKSNF